MQKAASRSLAFKLLAAAASLSVTAAFLAVAAPPVRAAQVGGVQGTVRDNAGKPIRSADILLTPVGGGQPQHARSDTSGYYSFAGVQPGAYTLQVKVVTFNTIAQAITVFQDNSSTVDFALTKAEGPGGSGTRHVSNTHPNDTGTKFTVTALDEQREKGQPNNLYQSQGLLTYKPGVTLDAGQYPHLRGSDQNQIGFSLDGIDLRDPIYNQFATNLVTVGVRSSNVVTGGPSADYGGAIGGYLNQITVNGRDIAPGKLFGGFVENTNGPAHPWQYYGGNTQIGGVLLNNKIDYALSSIVFKTHYADNTQISSLQSSHDESGKFNYYASPNDTFTAYFAHGAQNYNYYETTPNSQFFDTDRLLTDPATGRQYYSVRDLGSNFNDHNLQTYNLDHFTYKHNFTPSSFLQYRIFQLHQGVPAHIEGVGDQFTFMETNRTGNQVDYFNQFNKQNTLKAGLEYLDDKGSYLRQVSRLHVGPLTAGKYYNDRISAAYPKNFQMYLADELRSADNKLTLNYGLRYTNVTYKVQDSQYADSIGQSNPSEYTTKSVDPRLGLSYSPNLDLTFRTSYAITSQPADMRRIQRVAPIDVGAISTSLKTDPLFQSQADFINSPLSRINLSHSKDVDLGVERAFSFNKGPAQGQYTLGVTGYRKFLYDLTYESPANYDPNAGPTTTFRYDNEGKGRADGVEVSLRKIRSRPSDWNGYLNYTNQVVRLTDDSTVSYLPYFTEYEGGNPLFVDSANGPVPAGKGDLRSLNHLLFAPGWDQRHTIGLVVGKRFTKLLETSFVLDAGSGLPFFSAATSDGSLVPPNFSSVGPGFADIHSVAGGDAEFSQVPIAINGSGKLPQINPVAGYTGWHYKISVNTNFYLTPTFSLFLNVDNIFDKKTALNLGTGTIAGEPYYLSPTPQYPQGQEVYRAQSQLTPIFLTFGFRQRF